MRNTKS